MLDAVDALGRDHAGRVVRRRAASACPVRCTARCCWTRPAPCCVPPSCGTMSASTAECAELEAAVPNLRQVTGNIAMPGFTAPKLLWVRKHEPAVFARLRTVLLPKAYIRYRMTGEMIEEMSDASGTLWLDVGARDWSDVSACGHRPVPSRPCRAWSRAMPPPGRFARNSPLAGAWRDGPFWPAAPGTTPRARSGCRRSGQATRSSRWAHPACCSPRPSGSGRIRKPPSTRSVMRCPRPGTRWA